MEIIPAIDLREGACARLLGNDPLPQVYSDDPIKQALLLKQLGAAAIHITDLDGAFTGRICNLRIIQEIVESSGLFVQLSGGIRSIEQVDTLLSIGVARLVLGVAFLRDREMTMRVLDKYGERLAGGVDGRDGQVATEGFETAVSKSVSKLLEELRSLGMRRIIYTDLCRYGLMKGPNFEGIEQILGNCGMKAIVAGGVSSYEAIERLKAKGAEGVIIGKALYAGVIDLERAMAIAAQ
ncbi:MAG: 1-(5-phosphoribosyl)-5-[(5-phosphoribosylamino)methylideneamino] imidazole-4-carboxamide isomerase [Bacillota bacterium]|nr:1-(5-phosphoribosyl)-5-[(5-phosphoribosylamino)methylideneamino] imidazole-4-carboxamide isomerase [Bacillota bacterium]